MSRRFIPLVVGLACLSAGAATAPPSANAFASVEPPPKFSAAPGLPDGRIYEQVSPADKNGNEAGAGTAPFETGAEDHYGFASVDGEAVLFEGTGPMGESPWADSVYFVATKDPTGIGWSTRAFQPRGVKSEGLLAGKLETYLDPAPDLTSALVEPANDPLAPRLNEECGGQVFLVGSDPFVAGTWLEQPSPGLAAPVEACGDKGNTGAPVGGTPDFSTVYFAYAGTLLPEDAARTAYAGGAWGFYEYTNGVLAEAGVLPDGSVSRFGAVPAASGHGRNPSGNEVSVDGSRVFFVSPDPASLAACEAVVPSPPGGCVPQLYVREHGTRTSLVSRDELLPESGGLPVGAPGSVVRMRNRYYQFEPNVDGSWVFASADGSQAFFESDDALTQRALEVSPGSEPKAYDFDVNTDTLTYLPGVSGEFLAASGDGSSLAFLRAEGGGQPAQLDLWRAGAGGGTVTSVAQLAVGSVPEARLSGDGSVLVFQTSQDLSGGFNAGGFEEIYRFDVASNGLGCVSCPPVGVTPRGSAALSMLYSNEIEAIGTEPARSIVDERGISADGDRVFFESPDPLVAQDSNTDSPPAVENENEEQPQGRDVYEWENGVVYLISSGSSTRDSFLLDSSESGDDVFFATTQGLVPGDTDGGYDVYDARVPHPGDNPPAAAVPCEGSVCQGPPRVESPLAPPARATFPGTDNLTPELATTSPPKKTTTKAVKCRRGYVKHKNKCVKNKKSKRAKKASTNRRAKS